MKTFKWLLVVLTVAFTAVNLVPAESAYAQELYAAIAYSQETGRWGYAYQAPSRYEAEDWAQYYANDSTAFAVVWVRNGYAALAVGDDVTAYGWAWASTEQQARSMAMSECRERTSGCYVPICVHSEYGPR